MVLTRRSSAAGSLKLATAIELPKTSCSHRTLAGGLICSPVSSNRRAWLSRGRNISRWSPKVTGAAPSSHSHDRHETHATARRAPQVVRQPELRVGDLAGPCLAAQLEPHLVHHAEPAGADRMAEALEPAVRIHRLGPIAVEAAREHVLPGLPAWREAHVLHEDELRRREAVVHL